ncbi:MAG: hypothetical protein KDB61_00880 [Planctomycetes bacterium]|nr:hypothetical protein [Planctomycetota bacterium]
MTGDISLKTFLYRERTNRNNAVQFTFHGTVEKVPVVYNAFRMKVETFLVGHDRHDERPVQVPAKPSDLTEHLREIILSEQMQQFLAKRA